MFRASASKLNTYRRCPFQYKCIYVDKIADQFRTPRPYLTMGAHVHNALFDFYDKMAVKERTYKNLENILRRRWRENRAGFQDQEEERKYGIQALQMLRLFNYKMDVRKNPVLLEDYYDADIGDDMLLIGRIDRVDEIEEGLHIIDYKTGKKGNEEEMSTQLLIYSIIVSRNRRQPVLKASSLFLKNFEWFTIEPDETDLMDMVQGIKDQVELIRSDTTYRPVVGDHCRFCDFVEVCPKKEDVQKLLKEQAKNN